MTTVLTWQVTQTFTDGSGVANQRFSDFREAFESYQKYQRKNSQKFRVELFPITKSGRV